MLRPTSCLRLFRPLFGALLSFGWDILRAQIRRNMSGLGGLEACGSWLYRPTRSRSADSGHMCQTPRRWGIERRVNHFGSA